MDNNHTEQEKNGLNTVDKNPNGGNEKKGFNVTRFACILLIGVLIFMGLNRFVFSQRADAGTPGTSKNSITELGLSYYIENYGDGVETEGVEAVLRNFGCHSEIHILDQGKVVLKLYYSGGRFIEI